MKRKSAIVKVEVMSRSKEVTEQDIANVILGMEILFNGGGSLPRDALRDLADNLDKLRVHLELIGFDYRGEAG